MNGLAIACRVLAILIAMLGLIDPLVVSMRDGQPEIALVSTGRADSALARRVRERLDGRYTVMDGQWDAAAATIIVGSSMPAQIPTNRTFAVRDEQRPAISRFDVPAT